jgi:hypothetical protein
MKILSSLGRVISGFPGIGKSKYAKLYPNQISDSDSSRFDKSNFPQNYIEHILERRRTHSTILVSSHAELRQALCDHGIYYTLVYPELELKEIFLERYRQRGSPDNFVSMMDKNWDYFVTGCMEQRDCDHIVIDQPDQYLSDVL